MSSFNRETYLATTGNLPVKAAGSPVILDGTGPNDDLYNVLVGELVVWDPKQNLSLSAAAIATANNIVVSLGVGDKPGTLATDLIHIGGEQLNLCDFRFKATVSKPVCGVPQIVDVFFDCAKCDETYTLVVHLNDSRIRSEYGWNQKAEYAFPIATSCCGCDDCSPETNCDEIRTKLLNLINSTVQTDPSLITYFGENTMKNQYQPFRAVRLHTGTGANRNFDLVVDQDKVDAIAGINVGGVVTSFTNTTVPGDATKTFTSQLNRVLTLINKALEGVDGNATLIGGTSPDYGYKIQINAPAATTVTLVGPAAAVVPADSVTTPLAANAALTCGIRFITDPIQVPCDCAYPPNLSAPNTYSRTIEVHFAGEGWVCDKTQVVEAQAQVLPEGYGYFYQDKAHHRQYNGGSGRNFRNTNRTVGKIGLPDKFSRTPNAASTIQCDETYCVYNLLNMTSAKDHFNNAHTFSNKNFTQLLVPEAHATTRVSWETYLAALQARGICAPGDIECV